MNMIDATICLLLAAKIHGTDQALRDTAKSLTKKLPRSARGMMFAIINSKKPMVLLSRVVEDVPIPELSPSTGADASSQAEGSAN
ncbi:hypothetical protein D3C75_1170340 [compost metagenome]